MKLKNIIAPVLCVLVLCGVFTSCSSTPEKGEYRASSITDDTMLIAYTQDSDPFIKTDKKGNASGFYPDLVDAAFASFKNEYKNYKFIRVDPSYRLGEDTAYTGKDGRKYIAYVMCGLEKNTGTVNEDYKLSKTIVENDVITVVKNDSKIKNYSSLSGASAAVYSNTAKQALAENSAIKANLKSAKNYKILNSAVQDLVNGKADCMIIDTFNYFRGSYSSFKTLPGTLARHEYAFGFSASKDYSASFNEAVAELTNPDYKTGSTVPDLAKKYFGSSKVCVFDYKAVASDNQKAE